MCYLDLVMVHRFAIEVPTVRLEGLCERWKVAELALFGSALGESFGPDSDIDVLVGFLPMAEWDLLDLIRMEEELADLFGRRVDLVTRSSVESSRNSIRRQAILGSLVPVYVSR